MQCVLEGVYEQAGAVIMQTAAIVFDASIFQSVHSYIMY